MEQVWGMAASTFNLRSTRNVIRRKISPWFVQKIIKLILSLVRCEWHAMFDENDWAIVPSIPELGVILERFNDAIANREPPNPTLSEVGSILRGK
jgi:hypothetical protein